MLQETEFLKTNLSTTERIRWSSDGDSNGPVIVLFVGIHGNETAGIEAIDNITESLKSENWDLFGTIYAITGNIEALKKGVRFVDVDLNRLWELFDTQQDYSKLNGADQPSEYLESLQIKSALEAIFEQHKNEASEFIFADLHTTSSESCAFILLNDTLSNRDIARKFPVPQILGIEENIYGTLLSYINNLGYKAIGFEAGAHMAVDSINRSEAFLWMLFHNTGVIQLDRQAINYHVNQLQAQPDVPDTYYDIRYHHYIEDNAKFEMLKGFNNFDIIQQGTPLAYDHGELISAGVSGRIFMPLYQQSGNDGFMIIDTVSPFWLRLSSYLRKSFVHNLLKYLPGVSQLDNHIFEVNLRIARFLVKDIFHLFGYRVTEKDEYTLTCYRR
jgi:predicted deacylase